MVARPCCNQSLCYEGPSSDLVNTSHGRDIQRLLLSEECNIFGDDGMTHDVKKNHEENKKTARSKKVAINKYGLRVKEVHIYSMHKERKEQKMAERGGEKKKKKESTTSMAHTAHDQREFSTRATSSHSCTGGFLGKRSSKHTEPPNWLRCWQTLPANATTRSCHSQGRTAQWAPHVMLPTAVDFSPVVLARGDAAERGEEEAHDDDDDETTGCSRGGE